MPPKYPTGPELQHRHGCGSKPMVPFWGPPILVYFSGDWDVHWGYGILTHGHMWTDHFAYVAIWNALLASPGVFVRPDIRNAGVEPSPFFSIPAALWSFAWISFPVQRSEPVCTVGRRVRKLSEVGLHYHHDSGLWRLRSYDHIRTVPGHLVCLELRVSGSGDKLRGFRCATC